MQSQFDMLYYGFLVIVFFVLVWDILILLPYPFFQRSKTKSNSSNEFVSVLVCAKNEAKNIESYIPKILEQNYRNFEIILINDSSWDSTLEVMHGFAENNENVRVINVLPNTYFLSSKKYALSLGIKAAKGPNLLFIDADCYPESEDWIGKMMLAKSSGSADMVLGFGMYKKSKGWVNRLTRFETLKTAINYLTLNKYGESYMGVGRNLLYTKKLWIETQGFSTHMNVMSGDDDLFIQQIAAKSKVVTCMDQGTLTISKSKNTIKEYIQQKGRHVSTSKHYRNKFKVFLSLQYLWTVSYTIFLPVFLWFSIYAEKPLWLWVLVPIQIALRFLVNFKMNKAFKTGISLLEFPVLKLYLVLIQFLIFIKYKGNQPQNWS